MINNLVYFQIAVVVSYLIFIQSKFGSLHSISQSYYELKKRGYLFTFFCWGLSIPMLIIGGSVEGSHGWLFFMSGAGLGFVGAAASFRQRTTDIIHYTGAAFGIVFSLIGIGVVFSSWIPILGVIAICTAIIKIKINNPIYWMEVVSIIGIVLGLLFR